MLNESLIKYLAGLLDADGSLSFAFKCDPNRPDHHFVGLALSLASSDAVDKVGFVLGLPETTGMGGVYRTGKENQFITWRVSKRSDLEMLLPRLVKHMVIKAKHWQMLLETWRALRSGSATVTGDEREELVSKSRLSRSSNTGPLKAKNHPSWAWVAGYLDGDGYYNYRKHYAKTTGYWQWSMSVGVGCHKDDVVGIELLAKAFGGSISPIKDKPMMVWRRSLGYQSRSFALSFLPKVLKHARFKRDKIQAIIHHHQQRLSVPGSEKRFCSVDGCNSEAHGNGLCQKHYLREYRASRVSDSLTHSLMR